MVPRLAVVRKIGILYIRIVNIQGIDRMHHLATRDHQATQHREYGHAPCPGAFTNKNEIFHAAILYIPVRSDKHPATLARYPHIALRESAKKRRNVPN